MPPNLARTVAHLLLAGWLLQRSGAQIVDDIPSSRIDDELVEASAHLQVLESLEKMKAACATISDKLTGASASRLADGSEDLDAACIWVREHMKRGEPLERRLDTESDAEDDGYPEVTDPKQNLYPWPHTIILILVMSLVVYLWETLVLQSTACWSPFCNKKKEAAKEETATAMAHSFGPQQVSTFWSTIQAYASSPLGSSPLPAAVPCIRFVSRVHHCYTADEQATVGIERTGPCYQPLVVKAKTALRETDEFAAGADCFEETEEDIQFAPGQRVAYFQVPIYGDDKWDSGKLFMVKLVSVIYGSEVLEEGQEARVYVLDSHQYPGDAPPTDKKNTLQLTWYFWNECYGIRGWKKITKTFIGVLYPPFGSVVVTSIVTKLIIDWASEAAEGEAATERIAVLTSIQFISWLIERWADQLQTQNRGRTGGIRQTHRRWLFDKLLIVGQIKRFSWTLSGSEWFYAAVYDVNSITSDVYWQVFKIAQNVWGVFLTLVVLIGMDIRKANKNSDVIEYQADFLVPSLILIGLIPISGAVTFYKKPKIEEQVRERTLAEADWMDYWSWLSHCVKVKFGFSFREISSYEKLFDKKNKTFVGYHQKARDWMNDSEWITQWLVYIAYMAVLVWGAFALTVNNIPEMQSSVEQEETANLKPGEYAVLLSLFQKVGKYLVKLNDSMVLLYRGQVSLLRVQKLLNEVDEGTIVPHGVYNHINSIEMTGVSYQCEFEGMFGSFEMKPGVKITIPLGAFVRVSGSEEEMVVSVLGLLSGNLNADTGEVALPGWLSVVFCGEYPAKPPGCLTVVEEIVLVGACDDKVAHRLARVFGLPPNCGSHHLLPAGAKTLDFLKAMLRDPDVLVLARPFCFLPKSQRAKIIMLLKIWQRCGGTPSLIKWLSGEQFVPEEKGHRRTIILFELNIQELSPDVDINVDDYAVANPTVKKAVGVHAPPGGMAKYSARTLMEVNYEEFEEEESEDSEGGGDNVFFAYTQLGRRG